MERFERIILTGDIHGDVYNLYKRLSFLNVTERDLIILLGDCGFEFNSYYSPDLNESDINRQLFVKKTIPATILCVQGSHEVPFNEMHGNRINKFGSNIIESNGIYFAPNGSVLKINDKNFLVIGGAYSADKEYRIKNGYPYWKNEEMTSDEMRLVLSKVSGNHYNYVLSHTCPFSQIPTEALMKGVDQAKVEHRTESFLDAVKQNISFDHWYCGYFHINKSVDKLTFLNEDFEILDFYTQNLNKTEESKYLY